jgi:acyl carrier protein
MSDDAQKRGQLVAFVVPKARNKLTNAKLRAQLKLRLPDYMVPSVFMFLKKFPTTSGSKVDRQALAQLSKTKRAGTLARLKPRNSVEQALCTIWRDQLEVGDLGVDEDFTELGGDSLSSARVVTAINDLFPLRVSLSSVFEVPTIKRLAEFIRAHETASGQSEKIASAFLKVEAMSAAEVAAALAKD